MSTTALTISLLGLALHAGLLTPAYVGGHASGRPDLTVLTANLRLGQAHVDEVLGLLDRSGADVAVFEEVTPEILAAIVHGEHGFSYFAGEPAPGAYGTVVLSRYPLEHETVLPLSKGTWRMEVKAPRPFTLVAVHTSQPLFGYPEWRADHDALRSAVAAVRGPLVVAGDFNATLDHRPMRRLLGDGLSDAARQANSGWQPTWPGASDAAGSMPFQLGLMALDHVLVSRQLSAISTRTFLVRGSDHRALLARLAWR
jgi:endonuclease/exonuclease/phosphatase (EEP) superfamily protein YafD